jgi:hypothetical protein
LAVRVLDQLGRVEPRFVVLHGESELSRGRARSDVDVAVAGNPQSIAWSLAEALAPSGMVPIMLWPYDRNSLTVFLADEADGGGVQLDLVCDPSGQGRYGFCTDALIDRAVPGERWPRLHPDDEMLYLVRKRQVKRDTDEVARLLGSVPADSTTTLIARAAEAFSQPGSDHLVDMLSTGRFTDPKGAAFDRRWRNIAANSGFYRARLRQAVGVWVSVSGTPASGIDETLEPMRGLLPSVVVGGPVRSRRHADLHRMRARLLVTADGDSADARADVTVDGSMSASALRSDIVAGMARVQRERAGRVEP